MLYGLPETDQLHTRHWVFTFHKRYKGVIMSEIASQITSLTIGYSTVYSRRRSKKTSRLRVTGLCAGNSPVTGEFPAQRASNVDNVSFWWRRHGKWLCFCYLRMFFVSATRGHPKMFGETRWYDKLYFGLVTINKQHLLEKNQCPTSYMIYTVKQPTVKSYV